MSDNVADGGVLDEDNEEDADHDSNEVVKEDGGTELHADRNELGGPRNSKGEKGYFQLPSNVTSAQHFKGITKSKKAGEIEVTISLPCR